jgi:hypothetical protein
MSDVYLAFGILLSLGLVFPGLITTWWLLFPGLTSRAERRVSVRPILAFAVGAFLTITITVMVLILVNVPLPGANFLAAALVVGALAIATVGAAGLTSWMASRLRERTNPGLSEAASFLRAVVALELAAAFPIIGWFLFIPLCVIVSLGAASLALFGSKSQHQAAPAAESAVTTGTMQTAGATDGA